MKYLAWRIRQFHAAWDPKGLARFVNSTILARRMMFANTLSDDPSSRRKGRCISARSSKHPRYNAWSLRSACNANAICLHWRKSGGRSLGQRPQITRSYWHSVQRRRVRRSRKSEDFPARSLHLLQHRASNVYTVLHKIVFLVKWYCEKLGRQYALSCESSNHHSVIARVKVCKYFCLPVSEASRDMYMNKWGVSVNCTLVGTYAAWNIPCSNTNPVNPHDKALSTRPAAVTNSAEVFKVLAHRPHA